jgi:2',3'-cyclic-nucleotide 2'-phosphodiesterase
MAAAETPGAGHPSILFIGDVVGSPGRKALLAALPGLRERHTPTFVVVNG